MLGVKVEPIPMRVKVEPILTYFRYHGRTGPRQWRNVYYALESRDRFLPLTHAFQFLICNR